MVPEKPVPVAVTVVPIGPLVGDNERFATAKAWPIRLHPRIKKKLMLVSSIRTPHRSRH